MIGEFASQRKTDRLCEVLSSLNATLETHKADPEEHLSKDQIVEVVHDTLQTAATTSDDRKLEALKQGLGYAFLADDPFERKQVFLQVLRGATVLELAVLEKVYDVGDPYIVNEGPIHTSIRPELAGSELNVTGVSLATSYATATAVAQGFWEPVKNEDRNMGKLLSFLAKQTDLDEGMLAGVLRLLDSKGLTSAAANLNRTDSKVVKWVPFSAGSSYVAVSPTSGYSFNVVKPSPIEATRTEFGAEFLRIFR